MGRTWLNRLLLSYLEFGVFVSLEVLELIFRVIDPPVRVKPVRKIPLPSSVRRGASLA